MEFAGGAFKGSVEVYEVISTIMFNWIAHFFAFYLIANVLTDPKRGERTISIVESARLTRILPTATLHSGILISLITVTVILFFLWRTSAGFEVRAAGYNQEASHYAGISLRKQVLRVFLIGGAIAGLAGAVQVMGRPPYYAVMSGLPQLVNLGFDGIGVAMIGRNHPIGIIFAAIFFGGLMVGGRTMQFDPGVPFELVRVIEGIIIIALAVPEAQAAVLWVSQQRNTKTKIMELAHIWGILFISLHAMVPITLAAIETIEESAGLFNIGLEGILLLGALAGALGAQASGSAVIGLMTGIGIGAMVGLIFGTIGTTLRGSQLITGVGINLFALGFVALMLSVMGAPGFHSVARDVQVPADPARRGQPEPPRHPDGRPGDWCLVVVAPHPVGDLDGSGG